MTLDQLLDVAILAANDSKRIIKEHLNKTKVLKYKGKTDLVTIADKQSEKIIIENILDNLFITVVLPMAIPPVTHIVCILLPLSISK